MFSFFGIGKKRSKLGKWLDSRGITQQWLVKTSGINKNTISDLCNSNESTPNMTTIRKIINALKEIDPNINSNDFFDM